MKKIFTLLTLCLLASAAWAVDITFVAGVDNGNSDGTAKAFYIEKEGIRIDISNGLANSSHYRIYKNQTATFTSSIGAITQIVFECTASGDAQYGPGCFTATPGDYSFEDKIGTWTGSATPVVFTASLNQVRATKIIVTVGNPGLSAPVITPAAGTYYSPIEVSITCATNGAKIYYTTNGSTPTTSSTQFTAPFTVNTDMTVKAISANNGETSDVVEAAYEFKTATPVANIAAFQNAADDEVLVFTNPVNVLVQSGSRMFVQDNTGRALFYGSTGQTYKNGDVIPAGFVGTKTTWDGEPELKDLSNFQPASGNSPIAAEPITTTQVDASRFAQYVSLAEVTFDKTNKLVIDAAGSAPYYCNMNVKDADIAEGTVYDVEAIIGSHGKDNTVYQILPTKITRHGTPGPGDGFGWGSMADAADGTTVTFEYESTVIKQAGRYLYAKDVTGFGLAYGDLGKTYQPGDVIPAGFSGTKTTYNAEPELATPFDGFQDASGQVELVPEVVTPSQVGHDVWAHYVRLNQVFINEDGTLTDANGNSCPYYNNTFNATLPADRTKPYDVLGVVASYGKAPNTVYQILPIEVIGGGGPQPPTPVASINELYALNKGSKGIFTTPLTTIYQNGVNLYVQDVEGTQTLVYGSVAGTFVNGDFINEAVSAWNEYQGAKQMIPDGDTFVKAGHGDKVMPDMMPIEEVSQDMVHRYLRFENVTLAEAEAANTFTMADETGEMLVFNKFSQDVTIPNLEPSKTYTVEGFLTVYKGQLELYPILIDDGSGLEGDVNGDGEVNIADINAAIDMILKGDQSPNGDVNHDGEVNIADINAVIDIILKS